MAIEIERISLHHETEDGFPISLTIFQPKQRSQVQATVVISNATGVQARFYHPFAAWLSTHGVAAFTFDYRYSGASFPLHWNLDKLVEDEAYFEQALHECPANEDLTGTWGRKDLASIVQRAYEAYPHAPLTVIGHSLGGHLVIVLPRSHLYGPKAVVSRVLNVCGGNAYYKNQSNPEESEFGFTEMIVKTLAEERLFRASNLGLGYDLPFGPGREWVDWFFHPHFSFGRSDNLELARSFVNIPLLYVGFEDDETINKHMMERYMGILNHSDGKKRSLWVNPAKRGWPVCGHVNSFMKSKGSDSESIPVEHGEWYATREDKSSSVPRGRDQTIWRLYLAYILGQPVDIGEDEYRLWKVEDERDVWKEHNDEVKATSGQPNRFDRVLMQQQSHSTKYRL